MIEENIPISDSINEGIKPEESYAGKSLDDLSPVEKDYLKEVEGDPEAYESRLDELGINDKSDSIKAKCTSENSGQRSEDIWSDETDRRVKEKETDEDTQTKPLRYFVNDKDWHIHQAELCLDKGDITGYKDHMRSAGMCSK